MLPNTNRARTGSILMNDFFTTIFVSLSHYSWPSVEATTKAQGASPVTFTSLRHISNNSPFKSLVYKGCFGSFIDTPDRILLKFKHIIIKKETEVNPYTGFEQSGS
jgi:hypothetical protein